MNPTEIEFWDIYNHSADCELYQEMCKMVKPSEGEFYIIT